MKSAAAYRCNKARQSQRSVVEKFTAKSEMYLSSWREWGEVEEGRSLTASRRENFLASSSFLPQQLTLALIAQPE
jgi:hypothetical protein